MASKIFFSILFFTIKECLCATFRQGMNPGMQLRVDQTSLNGLKRVCERFLPIYFNVDLEIKEEYDYKFNSSLTKSLNWEILWTNISYTEFDLHMDDVVIEFTNISYGLDDYEYLVKFDFPALKHWEITGQQHIGGYVLPGDSFVKFVVKDFDIDFEFDLTVEETGFLDPIVRFVSIDFGESYF